jgi:hypothetical protein
VAHGSTTSFTFDADTGYHVATVSGCGGAGYSNASDAIATYTYTTGPVTGDCSVTAEFALNRYYTVTPSSGSHGSMSPSNPQTVGHGSTTSFTVTPDAGYRITSIGGCGGSLSGGVYTTGAITGDCTVTARFGANAVPAALPDLYRVRYGRTLTVAVPGVLANDTDGNGDALSAVLVSGPSHAAAFSLQTDGSFAYTHDGSHTAKDAFTYKAVDVWEEESAPTTVEIDINPVALPWLLLLLEQ